MEPAARAAPSMTVTPRAPSSRAGSVGERARVLAGTVLVAAVAWSAAGGLVSADTKNDLYVDPWGFLARSLHLWDPQVTWGVMQNQGYGYLFPMGPFFGVTTAVLPAWVAQRLWWTLLLVVGFLAVHALLRALGVGSPTTRLAASVAWTLSPRVLTTLGGLSSETLPVLLAPAIALPVVLAADGRMPVRRAAALSGLAVLGCGGVNATATVLATVPTVLFLVTRSGWWRRPLTWWWVVAAACASAWWLGPLVVLGRYSPPFLDWIEGSADVVRHLTVVDVLRGTTHWLEHLVTTAGPWWPAGVPARDGAVARRGHDTGRCGRPRRPRAARAARAAVAAAHGGHRCGRPPRRPRRAGGLPGRRGRPGPVRRAARPAAQRPQGRPARAAPAHGGAGARPRRGRPRRVGSAGRAAGPRRAATLTVVVAVSPGLSGAMAPPGAYREIAAQWVDCRGRGSRTAPTRGGRSSSRPPTSASTTGGARSTSRCGPSRRPTTGSVTPCRSPRRARSGSSTTSSTGCRPEPRCAARWRSCGDSGSAGSSCATTSTRRSAASRRSRSPAPRCGPPRGSSSRRGSG